MPLKPRAEIRNQLRRDVVENYRAEFAEYLVDFNDLDRKSQGTVAIAGIFLAAIFSFVRQIAELPYLPDWLLLSSFGTSLLLLVLSVFKALQALKVRELSGQPAGREAQEDVTRLLALSDEELEERLGDLWGEQVESWGDCVQSIVEANQAKARKLEIAQGLLFGAIVAVAAITFVTLVGGVIARQ